VDVQGDLYEYLLMELTTAGKNGQFRTPRHIIRMIVKLVNPKIGNRICDPAAGTGGFLVNAYEHILEANTSSDIIEYDAEGKPHHLIGDKIADKKLIRFLKSEALTGYDFDSTMSRIGAMNLMLHGIDNPNLRYADTLSKAFGEKERYEIVLANPPFKGSIDPALAGRSQQPVHDQNHQNRAVVFGVDVRPAHHRRQMRRDRARRRALRHEQRTPRHAQDSRGQVQARRRDLHALRRVQAVCRRFHRGAHFPKRRDHGQSLVL
jgi:hypothetical protein